MTAGIATHSALDTAWLTRTLTGAGYGEVRVNGSWLAVTTETACINITVDDRRGLLRFTSVVGCGTGALPSAEGERCAALGLLQRNLDTARIVYYTDAQKTSVRAEYDLPILAGLSRGQFVSLLRAFTADLAVAIRFV
jgi:hypothetical protein